jgi:DNA-binding protein H-NS
MKQIRSMSLDELIKTRARLEEAIALRTSRERRILTKLLERMELGASGSKRGVGVPVHPLKGRKLPPRYRNPQNRLETWAGRGHKPKWLVSALKRGKKLESFAVT